MRKDHCHEIVPDPSRQLSRRIPIYSWNGPKALHVSGVASVGILIRDWKNKPIYGPVEQATALCKRISADTCKSRTLNGVMVLYSDTHSASVRILRCHPFQGYISCRSTG